MKVLGFALAVILGVAGFADAASITVDGDLSDWGVNVLDGTLANKTPSDFTPFASIAGLENIRFFKEDTDDTSNSYYVGPNYGGQDYDAEFIVAANDSTNLYVAIVSGQRPDNGWNSTGTRGYYAPGDLRIATSNGVIFGVEVGGGDVDGAGTAITEGANGSTYTLDSNGYTTAHTTSASAQSAGSIWSNVTWYWDPIPTIRQTQILQIAGGTLEGTADYYFSRDFLTSKHSIIEMAIPLSVFGVGDYAQSLVWRPSCGNDEVFITMPAPTPPGNIVPLPGAFGPGLLGLGMIGLGVFVRRRRSRHEI
jgi:hypothetical protein